MKLPGYDDWKTRTPDPHEGETEPPTPFAYDGDGTRCHACGERIRYLDFVIRTDEGLVHEDCR